MLAPHGCIIVGLLGGSSLCSCSLFGLLACDERSTLSGFALCLDTFLQFGFFEFERIELTLQQQQLSRMEMRIDAHFVHGGAERQPYELGEVVARNIKGVFARGYARTVDFSFTHIEVQHAQRA